MSATVFSLPLAEGVVVERLDERLRACADLTGAEVVEVPGLPDGASGWETRGERLTVTALARLDDGRLALVGLEGSATNLPVTVGELLDLATDGAANVGQGATGPEGQGLVVRTTLLLHALGLIELPEGSAWFDDAGQVRTLAWMIETDVVQDYAGYAADHLNVVGLTTGDLTVDYGGTVLVEQGD